MTKDPKSTQIEVSDLKLSLSENEVIDKEIADEFGQMKITESEMALIEELTPTQQRYAQLAVTTNMTQNEIAKAIRQPKARIQRWAKEPVVKLYMKKLQVDAHKSHRQQSTQQLTNLRDRLYGELEKRFDDFSFDNVPKNSPEWFQKKLVDTHVSMAPFKDVLKALEVVDKQIDNKDLIQTTQDEFVERVVTMHHEKKIQQRRLAKALERQGFTSYIELVEKADGSFDLPVDSEEAGFSESIDDTQGEDDA